jgi:hypothetical protein
MEASGRYQMCLHGETAKAIENAIRIAREVGREDIADKLAAVLKDRPQGDGEAQDQP